MFRNSNRIKQFNRITCGLMEFLKLGSLLFALATKFDGHSVM